MIVEFIFHFRYSDLSLSQNIRDDKLVDFHAPID